MPAVVERVGGGDFAMGLGVVDMERVTADRRVSRVAPCTLKGRHHHTTKTK